MKHEGLKKFFFWLVCALSVTGGYAQVDQNVQTITLEQAFKVIKKTYKHDVVYRDELINGAKPVKPPVKGKTLEVAMENLIEQSGLPIDFSITNRVIVLKKRQESKQPASKVIYEVRGRVTDEKGLPIPGASVLVEGTSSGTPTDIDGKFKIFVKDKNASLIFSFIGMKPQVIKYTGQKDLAVILKSATEELDAVTIVYTGYQKIDKRELTSSIATVSSENLDKIGALTVDQMLEGKSSGLLVTNTGSSPGAAAKIQVRSAGTFTGSRAPLWVVDGIIYEDPVPLSANDINSFDKVNLIGNALTGLNPQDIESINILKDASATAIYGTRAANGVIVVTTKRGKDGRTSITYSGSVSVTERPNYSDFNLMNSKERIDVSREIAEKNLGYPYDLFPGGRNDFGYEGALYNYRLGKIDFKEFQDRVGKAETMNTDWFKELYRPAISTVHNVNLSGGSNNVRYYFSVGYNDDQGTEKNVELNRITARSNIDVNLRKNIIISVGMSGSVQEAHYNHSSVNLFDQAYYNSRTMPFRNDDGSLFYFYSKDSKNTNLFGYNVENEMNNSEKNIDNKDFNLNAQLSWDIIKGVKFRASASYRNTTNLQEEWITENTNFIARLRTYEGIEDKIDKYVQSQGMVPFGGIYSGSMTSSRSLRGQAQLNLTQIVADKHVFNVNLGYEANSNLYKGSSGWNAPGYNHEQGRSFIKLPSISLGTDGTGLQTYANAIMMNWLADGGSKSIYPKITDQLTNSLSAFGIFNYSYNNRYIFNFNIRSDGSNQFGQYQKYKFKPTWSASVRWNIHNEGFLKNNRILEELAIRASYGFRGNSPSVTPYMIINNYKYYANFGENGATMENYPNANLTWEKTSTLNFGLNHSWFNGRLSGSFDFAYSHGTDLLLSRPVSLVNGQATQLYNGGEKKDYSYEVSLLGNIIRNDIWGWNVSANLTTSKEEVLAGQEGEDSQLKASNYLNGNIYLTGFPVDAFYSYQFDGLDEKGLPKFKNLESRPDNLSAYFRDVLTYSGRRTPQVYGGFNTEVRYKRWTLRGSFSYKAGHHIRLLKLYNGKQNMPMPNENLNGEFNNRWRNPGDESWAIIPGLSNNPLNISVNSSGGNTQYLVMSDNITPIRGATGYDLYNMSDIRVVSGSHIRLQSLSLRYGVPEAFLNKIGFNSMYINLQATNLAVWAFDKRLKGQDPEQVNGVGMPALPTYSLSINLSL